MARKAKRDLTIEQKLARGPIDLPFLALVMLLTALGLIVLLSASFPSAMYNLSPKVTDTGGDPLYYFNRQFGFALMGVVAMFIISKIDYQQFRWMSIFVLAGSVVLMLLVFVPGIGKTGGGAARWIKLGPVRFQPSEIAKVGIILYFAARLSKRGIQLGPPKDKKWNRRTLLGRTCERLDNIGFLELVPYGVALVVVLGVIYLQGHMSAMILVIVAAASVLFAAGISLGWFAAAGAVVAPLLWFIITQTNYMKARIDIWLDPFVDPRGNGYQPIQGRIAVGSGGLLGVGLGKSRQKFGFLPEAQNDYIFAVVLEELGLVGGTLIMVLFSLLIIRGFWLAIHARDRFGSLLIVGVTTQIALQTFLNIAVVTNLIPSTGISLPFFSSGGTALVIQLVEVGVVLSVSRQIPAPKAW